MIPYDWCCLLPARRRAHVALTSAHSGDTSEAFHCAARRLTARSNLMLSIGALKRSSVGDGHAIGLQANISPSGTKLVTQAPPLEYQSLGGGLTSFIGGLWVINEVAEGKAKGQMTDALGMTRVTQREREGIDQSHARINSLRRFINCLRLVIDYAVPVTVRPRHTHISVCQ